MAFVLFEGPITPTLPGLGLSLRRIGFRVMWVGYLYFGAYGCCVRSLYGSVSSLRLSVPATAPRAMQARPWGLSAEQSGPTWSKLLRDGPEVEVGASLRYSSCCTLAALDSACCSYSKTFGASLFSFSRILLVDRRAYLVSPASSFLFSWMTLMICRVFQGH